MERKTSCSYFALQRDAILLQVCYKIRTASCRSYGTCQRVDVFEGLIAIGNSSSNL